MDLKTIFDYYKTSQMSTPYLNAKIKALEKQNILLKEQIENINDHSVFWRKY